ncbi:unnamed protein product [Periconia digitata]|uniref:Secreted protein n=1 Tax=Periconia digitata TaxID=1303443 RepID=A0A9W4XR86_9PLEO|nr:unnamed protein product [Periconia digitata]
MRLVPFFLFLFPSIFIWQQLRHTALYVCYAVPPVASRAPSSDLRCPAQSNPSMDGLRDGVDQGECEAEAGQVMSVGLQLTLLLSYKMRATNAIWYSAQPRPWFQTWLLCSRLRVTGGAMPFSRLASWTASSAPHVRFDSVLTFGIADSESLCTLHFKSQAKRIFRVLWSCFPVCLRSANQTHLPGESHLDPLALAA